MVDAARARKLGERFQEIVAETLEMKVKDPRLGFVTVTSVRVSPDLREATVFYTVFGSEADVESTSAALSSAKGLVRTEIGKRTG
ncbi:MAG: 30S ribosome-binding factor RbfA, partial [Actinomycetes bacterium]